MIARKLQVCAAILAVTSMIASPLYGQAQAPSAAQLPGATPTPAASQVPTAPAVGNPTAAPPMTISLAPDYSHGPHMVPKRYRAVCQAPYPEPTLTNSPRLSQLIQNGKLSLTLDDAIALALENNLDIAVQRYTPWLDEMQLLSRQGRQPCELRSERDNEHQRRRRDNPVANPLISGVGVSNVASSLTQHSTTGNFGYTQGFAPGTEVSMSFNNSRQSSSTSANVFNPSLSSTLSVALRNRS